MAEICPRKIMNTALPLPSDFRIAELARLLTDNRKNEAIRNRYANVSRVLSFLGAGVVLSLSLFVAQPLSCWPNPFWTKSGKGNKMSGNNLIHATFAGL